MNISIFNEFIKGNILFDKIDTNNKNYEYYMNTKQELLNNNIISYTYKDIIRILNNSILVKKYIDVMENFETEKLYKSDIHGINHNIRTSIYALIISIYENVSVDDFKLIIEATKYHDIGRIDDNEDKEHGFNSSKKISFLNEKYTPDEINYLKTIITCHSLNDLEFEKIAQENGIPDIEKCKKMFKILKDSDGLDRVRLEYPYININYLRTDISKKLVLFSYEFYYNYRKELWVKKNG